MSDTEPTYNGDVIEWKGTNYVVVLSFNEKCIYVEDQSPLVSPQPGEKPRAVRGGFIYGGRTFLPDTLDPEECSESAEANAMQAQVEAEKSTQLRQGALQVSSIPAALEAEVVTRYGDGYSTREIAQWLGEEKQCKTSHASVDRLLQRHRRIAAQAKLAAGRPELLADIEAHRVAFDSALDTMALLEDYVFQLALNGMRGPDESVTQSFRMAQQRATLLDKRLRQGVNLFLACEQNELRAEARQSRTTAPANDAPMAAKEPVPIPPVAAPAAAKPATDWSSVNLAPRWMSGLLPGIVLWLLLASPAQARSVIADSAFERPGTPSASPSSVLPLTARTALAQQAIESSKDRRGTSTHGGQHWPSGFADGKPTDGLRLSCGWSAPTYSSAVATTESSAEGSGKSSAEGSGKSLGGI
jgi:hypothetical protein